MLDFALYTCIDIYCLHSPTCYCIKEGNVNPGHASRTLKHAVMEQRGLFPSGSEFLHCFNTNGFWLIHNKNKSLTIAQPLMYSSNLNINIHWAFVTFKILLDALQSIPFQISTSNYGFKLITTDQRPLIVFRASSSPPSAVLATGSGW